MDPLLPLLVVWAVVVLTSLGTTLWRPDNRRLLERWQQAAKDAGLTAIEVFPSVVTGYRGTLLVRIREFADERGHGTQVELAGPGLAPGLTLRREPWSAFSSERNPREIEIGDVAFDREVSVLGTPEMALAVLDPATRAAVRTLVRGPFEPPGHTPLPVTGELNHGVLRLDVRGHAPSLPLNRYRGDAATKELGLDVVVRGALALAERLVAPQDLAPRLASNLKAEPERDVRRRTFVTLLREFKDHAATRETLRSLRDDADPELRLRAGIALEADGRDVLLELARGEGADDATGARAVTALGGSLTVEAARQLLESAVRARRLQSAKACAGVLGRRGAASVPALVAALAADSPDLAEAAAHALGATEDASAEEPLLRALAAEAPSVALAAATALGRVGSRAAVAPLREAERRDAELRGAARQAIAQIQSRLAGAGHGQLSLASGEAGQLTLVDDETGRLSLDDRTA